MSLIILVPGIVVALLTLTASLAAVFRVGRLKQALDTAERAVEAWKEERDAAIEKAARIAADSEQLAARVRELEAEVHRLRELTDLSRYFVRQDANHREVVDELHGVGAGVSSLATAIETLAAMLRPLVAAS